MASALLFLRMEIFKLYLLSLLVLSSTSIIIFLQLSQQNDSILLSLDTSESFIPFENHWNTGPLSSSSDTHLREYLSPYINPNFISLLQYGHSIYLTSFQDIFQTYT